ncbi:MAG: bacillithiol system redox-active protein YtxJ [Flavobacteriales bacterium]|nr:bacillithiol system redox-active protein YtxJ [Flavobacteriales bacterium]
MDWIKVESHSDLNKIVEESFQDSNIGVAIFKHSTRCSISSVAKMRLVSFWDFKGELPIYYLDLIAFRDISNLIAEQFNVPHESPQLLIIKDGKCVYNASHLSISVKNIHSELGVKS